jgi:anaerobic ribonucleoside-triphosphate reductase activating protein
MIAKERNIIIFDLFGTILSDISNDYRKGLEYLQKEILNDCSLEQVFTIAEEFRRQYMSDRSFSYREAKMLDQLALFKERIGFKVDAPLETVEYNFFTISRINKINGGLLEALQYLKKKDYLLFVMSNTIFSSRTVKKCLADFGVEHFFENAYASSDCGYRKPSRKFFSFVYKDITAKVRAHRKDILFIGNNLNKDAIGASRFGFTPLWLSPKSDGFGEYIAGCTRIGKLSDLQNFLEENYMYVSGVSKQYSQADGPGNRLVVYMQGCGRHCPGCHNEKTWNFNEGQRFSVKEAVILLLSKLSESAKNITVSGGEPLDQPKALHALLNCLKKAEVNICVYTSYEFDEVPEFVKEKADYLKTGRYIQAERTTVSGFYGSENQKMWEKTENGIWRERK